MVKEKCGDLLVQPVDIIAHQTNCVGKMNAGIAKQIKDKLLTTEEFDKYVRYCDKNGEYALGTVQILKANDGREIANCFGENVPTEEGIDTNYEALRKSLKKVRDYADEKGLKVGIPGLLGCGLAGGDWNIVREMLYDFFGDSNDPDIIICYFDKDEYLKWNPVKEYIAITISLPVETYENVKRAAKSKYLDVAFGFKHRQALIKAFQDAKTWVPDNKEEVKELLAEFNETKWREIIREEEHQNVVLSLVKKGKITVKDAAKELGFTCAIIEERLADFGIASIPKLG